jgi:hypothetical protein
VNRITLSRVLFGLAAVYDLVLGVAFLAVPRLVFERCAVTPPNHLGYVQFPAALLIVFAIMFVAIAADPVARRGLIPYGCGLKVAYCAVSFAYWLGPNIPDMWKPFSIIDAVMLVLFVWAWVALGRAPRRGTEKKGTEGLRD